jgi:hypothetical protein
LASSSVFQRRPRLTLGLFGLLLLLLLLISAEVACRVYRHYWHEPNTAYFLAHQELGWVLNTRQKPRIQQNKCNENVALKPAPHPLLNKKPGKTTGTRVLFLGDSFTHAHTVSPGKAYFDVFEGLNPGKYTVYAAGIGGYGSLQEYLLLKKLHSLIKPDVVIWQLSGNDPHNNVFELDKSSFGNNSQRLRPYLDLASNRIELKDPRFFWFKHLCLSRVVFNRLLVLDARFDLGFLKAAEAWLALPEKRQVALMRQGLEVVKRVLARAQKEFPHTEFIGFSTDSSFDAAYARIFRQSGAKYLPRVYQKINQSPQPSNCLPLDVHWNHHGHQVAGKVIAHMLADELE